MVPTVAVLVDDLFFLAKIQETAKALGAKVLNSQRPEHPGGGGGSPPGGCYSDLNFRSASPIDSIRALKSESGNRTHSDPGICLARAGATNR